jgi:hypothetical protein
MPALVSAAMQADETVGLPEFPDIVGARRLVRKHPLELD